MLAHLDTMSQAVESSVGQPKLLTTLAILAIVCKAAAQGCSLEKGLVCGDDGFTYQNACLAASQGVKVAHQNPCSGRNKSADVAVPASLLATGKLDTNGSIDTADIVRFQGEGFKLVGRVKLVDTPLSRPMAEPNSKLSSERSRPLVAARITPTGHLYLRLETSFLTALAGTGQAAESPPFNPAGNITAPSSRKLLIWGADGRVQVTSRPFPYSAVGHISAADFAGRGYGCSGALIEQASIFTAGHCVFDAYYNQFSSALYFYPGRLSRTDITGWYYWRYATTWWASAHGLCTSDVVCDNKVFRFDWAVVRVSEPIGRTRGVLGIKYDAKKQGYTVTSAGYPGDKPYATMWKTSGKLNPFNGADSGIDDIVNGVVDSDLDIYGGQSGSNVWDSSYYTRALVNSMSSNGRAHHRTVTRTIYHLVMKDAKGVTLFDKTNFGGGGYSIPAGNYPKMDSGFDNWASSVSMSPGCNATLYEKTNFVGKSLVITKDTPSLGTFNDLTSSIKVACKVDY